MAREQSQQDQTAQFALNNGEERIKVPRQQRQVLRPPGIFALHFVSTHGGLYCWP